jgi:hypothetical protein
MSWEVIDKFIQMAASAEEHPSDVQRTLCLFFAFPVHVKFD